MTDHETEIRRLIALQTEAQRAEGPPSADERIARMQTMIAQFAKHADNICAAVNEDFGARSDVLSMMTEIMAPLHAYQDSAAHVREWMQPEKRTPHAPSEQEPEAWIDYQPVGVVGIMSPWNTPINLAVSPLFGVFAAGNRAVIKPSELTPRSSALLKAMVEDAFDESVLAVVTGDAEVGKTFCRMPFDHLVFTGGTEIGRHIMRGAAENLTPVTLELGGKSPVIISKSADFDTAVEKIMFGKSMNSGQVCVAPDYVLTPAGTTERFVDRAREIVSGYYPTIRDNPDYTAIVNDRHYARLKGYLDDAREKGARIVEVNPADEDFSQQPHRKIPPTFVLDVADDMAIAREEIFGPLLIVQEYGEIGEAIAHVNARPRPLALYYFGADEADRDQVLSRTVSGGVTVNDVMRHFHQHDLPFGGAGPSGIGRYHGIDGFREFSNARAVFAVNEAPIVRGPMQPPFPDAAREALRKQIKSAG
ncbi:MAG: coniferyl aldehyde dehydrogenase [Parvularculaceae bacterium]